ncbi:MAG: hypothetical protein ABS81_13320 [Pseudonocardia sp. SCN 72-86]|nr:MAG: hypothetical protein ABS81_13320 [Pseudonocardia sp. SCN 72-86]
MVLGFVPLLLFTVLCYWLPVGWAAVVGFVAAIGVITVTAEGGIKLLPTVQGVILLVFAVLGFAGGPGVDTFLMTYGRGVASLVLGAVIVATASSMPFTAQFARATTPRELWDSPVFLAANRRISLAWGLAVLVVGACHLLGAWLQIQGVAHALTLLVDWVVPILAVVRAVSVTKHVVSEHA